MNKTFLSLRNFFVSEDTQGDKLVISADADNTQEEKTDDPNDDPDDEKEADDSETEADDDQSTTQASAQALTERATKAEATVTQLTAQVAQLTQERDRYKAWYEKQAGVGKQLPGEDASQVETSVYNSHALEVYRKSH